MGLRTKVDSLWRGGLSSPRSEQKLAPGLEPGVGTGFQTRSCAKKNAPRDPSKTPMIDKTYQPSEVEGRIYRTWEKAGVFRAGRPERAQANPYSWLLDTSDVADA